MKKKLENFIFYYKYHIIAVIVVAFIAVVLLKDSEEQQILEFVIVDDTSQMDIETGKRMLEDFEKQKGIKSGSVAFRYKSMYPQQDNYKDIAFGVAGINDYQKCFQDGSIDMVITTADRLENTKEEENKKEMDTEETLTNQEESIEEESTKEEIKAVITYEAAPLEQVLSKEEMKQYEKYLYYLDDKAVGIVFDKCGKAKEYFGDNYPTGYHYILQVAAGSADEECVREFIEYLIGE